jgi:hypothetical protein
VPSVARTGEKEACPDMTTAIRTKADEDHRSAGADMALRTTEFELTLRGYHRGQVDRYVTTCEVQLSALAEELSASHRRERQMSARLAQCTAELERCTCNTDTPASRVIGTRIQRMILLAEQESAALREQAARELEQARLGAAALLTDAQSHAQAVLHEFENALSARRVEEARAEAARRLQWDARAERQHAAVKEMLENARQLGAEAVALVRRMAEHAAGQQETLLDEARRVERAIAELPKDFTERPRPTGARLAG